MKAILSHRWFPPLPCAGAASSALDVIMAAYESNVPRMPRSAPLFFRAVRC